MAVPRLRPSAGTDAAGVAADSGAVVAEGAAAIPAALESLLEVSDSLMTYRSRYYSRFQLGAVLDLLMTDETNPRSMAFQLVECTSHAAQLPRESVVPGPDDRRAARRVAAPSHSPHRPAGHCEGVTKRAMKNRSTRC